MGDKKQKPIDIAKAIEVFEDEGTALLMAEGFLNDFLGDTAFMNLYEPLSKEEWFQLKEAAHTLKGNSSYLGIGPLNEEAAALEKAAIATLADPSEKNKIECLKHFRKIIEHASPLAQEIMTILKFKKREAEQRAYKPTDEIKVYLTTHLDDIPRIDMDDLISIYEDQELAKMMVEGWSQKTFTEDCFMNLYYDLLNRKWKVLERGAHSLKGACKYGGIKKMEYLANNMQTAAKRKEGDECYRLLILIMDEAFALYKEINPDGELVLKPELMELYRHRDNLKEYTSTLEPTEPIEEEPEVTKESEDEGNEVKEAPKEDDKGSGKIEEVEGLIMFDDNIIKQSMEEAAAQEATHKEEQSFAQIAPKEDKNGGKIEEVEGLIMFDDNFIKQSMEEAAAQEATHKEEQPFGQIAPKEEEKPEMPTPRKEEQPKPETPKREEQPFFRESPVKDTKVSPRNRPPPGTMNPFKRIEQRTQEVTKKLMEEETSQPVHVRLRNLEIIPEAREKDETKDQDPEENKKIVFTSIIDKQEYEDTGPIQRKTNNVLELPTQQSPTKVPSLQKEIAAITATRDQAQPKEQPSTKPAVKEEVKEISVLKDKPESTNPTSMSHDIRTSEKQILSTKGSRGKEGPSPMITITTKRKLRESKYTDDDYPFDSGLKCNIF